VVDIDAKLATNRAAIDKLTATNAIYEALSAAVKGANVPDDAIADLRPFNIVTSGEHGVKIAVGSRTGRAVGTRVSNGRGELVKITSANPDHSDLVGATIGKDGTYPSWRALVQTVSPEVFEKLESGKGNWSAHGQANKLYGLTSEPVATAS
jgi:hypothetical protein